MGLNKKNKYANEVERRNGVKKQIKNENLILFVYTLICRLCLEKKHIKMRKNKKY